ncbi:MAG: response regulator [Rhodospirillaceae bacterium]
MSNKKILENISILVIDDSRLIRDMLKAILKSFGVREVFEAGDGFAGFQVLSQHRVDIVICDVFMAPMHGYQFLEMVRAGQTPPGVTGQIPPDTPVIMVTGKTMKLVADNPDANWDAILDKPIDQNILLEVLLCLVKEKGLGQPR